MMLRLVNVAIAYRVHAVSLHDNRDVPSLVQFLKYAHDFHARARVQITRRLVGKQDRRGY